jgi:tetratricopeptide (TPR) repeat protein
MVKYNYFYLIFICLIGLTTYSQKVSKITFKQEQSNILVSYDLETKTPCKVSLYVSTNGGTSWQGPLKKVTGNVGDKVISGKNSILWNVLEEFQELSGSNIKFQVRAEELKSLSIAFINKALIKNPKDAKLFKLRGDIKKESNDRKGAIADYTKAISLNPKYADAYKERGKLMFGNYKAAISDYSKAISLNPKDASTFYDRANSKFGLEDFEAAKFDYSKAIELEPNNTEFIFARARAKRELKENLSAIEDINRVIDLDSTFENIYYFRGVNKYDFDVDGANDDFNKHIKNSTAPVYEYKRIAHFRWYNNDYNTAIVYFTKAIEILQKPKTNDAVLVDTTDYGYDNYLGRAFSKYKLKDFVGANSDLDKFVELSDDKANAYRQIALHYQYSFKEINDSENAIKYLTKAINLNPNNVFYIDSRAELRFDLKDYKGAIEDYSKAILLEPKGNYYYYRGLSKFYLSDYRGAISDYTKAILIDSKTYSYYNSRGDAKFNIGDYKGAIADYSKVILLDPKNGEAYLSRGDAKIHIDDKTGACKDFNTAGKLGEDDAYDRINENCYKNSKKTMFFY